jgi:peptide-methionine (S)-S-oxide reductase
MRQGNDVGTQYRSLVGTFTPAQVQAVGRSRDMYQERLTAGGKGDISTEVVDSPAFYFAEPYHQQYLFANPNGYCGLQGTGVSCPIGTGVSS